jgi:hypothetical protein
MAVHGEEEVVPLDAGRGIPQLEVPLPVSPENICK